MPLALAVVMPVYNEEACIVRVVNSWLAVLDSLQITYRIIVLNDGSIDRTAQMLETFLCDPRCDIITKPNSGHGPTILVGYSKAVEIAEWVFQCDSDDEIGPEHFPDLWRRREDFDALLGVRVGKRQSHIRRLLSAAARLAVRLLFGSGISDVNVPYRLIRSAVLRRLIQQIPPDTFAPNVVISAALCRGRARIFQLPVRHRSRSSGVASIRNFKLFKGALKAFWQTLRYRWKLVPTTNLAGCLFL